MAKKNRRAAKARRALLTLSLVLVVAFAAVGGTLAWLTDKADTVTNTFSPTTINIELKEHDYIFAEDKLDTDKEVITESDYKMVPGKDLPKDPFVRVKADSEDCYVFVTVTKSANFNNFITANINTDAWTLLLTTEEGVDVYYYGKNNSLTVVPASEKDTKLNPILLENKVTVKNDVTKSQMDAMLADPNTKPTITFNAYAIQADNLSVTAIADIWALAKTAVPN